MLDTDDNSDRSKTYLGDSVYLAFDGYNFTLTTENGYGPSNTIVLEPEVLNNLFNHVNKLTKELKKK